MQAGEGQELMRELLIWLKRRTPGPRLAIGEEWGWQENDSFDTLQP
jgi:hypothetical protein